MSLTALRERELQQLRNSLRRGQQSMADWQGGQLAVSAVPGAGKSTGMTVAAAFAIAHHQLHARRQLVVVTFTRSAAANIKGKIRESLKLIVTFATIVSQIRLLPKKSLMASTSYALLLLLLSLNKIVPSTAAPQKGFYPNWGNLFGRFFSNNFSLGLAVDLGARRLDKFKEHAIIRTPAESLRKKLFLLRLRAKNRLKNYWLTLIVMILIRPSTDHFI